MSECTESESEMDSPCFLSDTPPPGPCTSHSVPPPWPVCWSLCPSHVVLYHLDWKRKMENSTTRSSIINMPNTSIVRNDQVNSACHIRQLLLQKWIINFIFSGDWAIKNWLNNPDYCSSNTIKDEWNKFPVQFDKTGKSQVVSPWFNTKLAISCTAVPSTALPTHTSSEISHKRVLTSPPPPWWRVHWISCRSPFVRTVPHQCMFGWKYWI